MPTSPTDVRSWPILGPDEFASNGDRIGDRDPGEGYPEGDETRRLAVSVGGFRDDIMLISPRCHVQIRR